MKSTLSFTFAAATVLLSASTVLGGAQTEEGCFTSSTGLTFNSSSIYNSIGYCGTACLNVGYSVFAMTGINGVDCWCGDELPPTSDKTDDSDCTTSCPGYPSNICGGGTGYWITYLTGTTSSVSNAAAAASSAGSKASGTATATTSASASVVTEAGQTVVVTASTAPTSGSSSSTSSGPNKAAIAAGVVVGLVAIAAIVGGGFLFIRNRRRREVEEEYRRNAAVSSFIGGGKPPGSSGGVSSFTDTRLDPAVMAHRRMSDGSIADNQDYSRRILKVTNA